MARRTASPGGRRFQALKGAADSGRSHLATSTPLGDPGNRRLDARYTRAPIAHASIGPSCALARLDDGLLRVWTHSQGIFALRGEIAHCLGLAPELVRVTHVPGSGCYGHNAADDAALDAAIVATRLPGQPVRVRWSREDELSRGPVGAAMATTIEASLDTAGRIASWSLSVRSAPHSQRPGFGGFINLTSAEALDPSRLPDRIEDLGQAAGGGASRNAVAIYDLPFQDVRVEIDASCRFRTSSLRSLGAHGNVFAIESAMDELAEMAGADPLAFRLRHLGDERCRAVLEGAAEMAGWPGAAEWAGPCFVTPSAYKGRGACLLRRRSLGGETVRVEHLAMCRCRFDHQPRRARSQIEGGAIRARAGRSRNRFRSRTG